MTDLPTPIDIGYGKVVITEQTPDGTTKITTETIYDSALSGYQVEIEKSINVNQQSVLNEIIDSLATLNRKETRKLTLVITSDKNFQIERLVKKYPTIVDKLGRRQ